LEDGIKIDQETSEYGKLQQPRQSVVSLE